jgi:uncharacterized protein YndB with AHSA1/START domain
VITIGTARAAADLSRGSILATVEVGVPPERAFQSLAGEEMVRWWVRPGVFDTREWSGDVRHGGRWRASGLGRGNPYVLEGEFLEVDRPRRLVHTWHSAGAPAATSTVTYELEAIDGGTRITLRHEGIKERATCAATCIGWETSFEALAQLLG